MTRSRHRRLYLLDGGKGGEHAAGDLGLLNNLNKCLATWVMARFAELSLAAQTAYAEVAEQARALELSNALSGLKGSFQRMRRKGTSYWYFAYRDLDQRVRMAYVGPDEPRVQRLVERFAAVRRHKPLASAAQAALALGCTGTAPKHFRVVKRLAEYGFFRAGGVLIGTHAFLALGNLLGVRWLDGSTTLDVDFAHAGRNVSIALPASVRIDVHGALESLEMGLLPITQFDGRIGAQYRNPKDEELRIDFVTSMTRRNAPVVMRDLNLALEPLKFMEFLLEDTTQACLLARTGACTVNVPAPERFAVHKLIVYAERPSRERTKSRKDLLQVASLLTHLLAADEASAFNAAWRDAVGRGAGWRARAEKGRTALLAIASELAVDALWRNGSARRTAKR